MSEGIEIGEAQKTRRGARTDQVGKVFIVVSQRVRKCLVCEELFTRRASAEHSKVICYPTASDVRHTGRLNERR
jgi:hypothetical protein